MRWSQSRGCRLSTGRKSWRASRRSKSEISSRIAPASRGTHHPLALLDIDLVANNDLSQSAELHLLYGTSTYKWETLRVHGTSLNQELIPPTVECVKTLGVVNVVYKHAAVSATVERNTQRLEALLSSGIPKLHIVNCRAVWWEWATHLHGYEPVINHDFFGEEVGAYCRLVACAELLVDLCLSCERTCLA